MTTTLKLALLAAAAGLASLSYADPITVPAGLTPGAQYRLIFVTDTSYLATDANIADYNAGVNTEANGVAALLALGATWVDVGSTVAVNAIVNIGQDPGVPIYNLGGQKVANDATVNTGSLFSASGAIQNPIDYDENGAVRTAIEVWTGTNELGQGQFQLGFGTTSTGNDSVTDSDWNYNGFAADNNAFPLYAISGILTVPGGPTTPEPSTLALLVAALLIAGVVHTYGRRQQLAPSRPARSPER